MALLPNNPIPSSGGGSPTGAAGGDLGSTYPNPTVLQVQGVAVSSANATALSNLSGTNTGDQTNISGNAGTVTHGVYTTDSGSVTNTMLAGSIGSSKLATYPLTTKGDLWGYAAADARVPVGTDKQMLQADSTQTTGLSFDWPSIQYKYQTVLFSDFANGAVAEGNTNSSTSGTGAVVNSGDIHNTSGNQIGVVECAVGTTTTGLASIGLNPSGHLYSNNGQLIFETSVKSSALSNGTDRYTINAGIFASSLTTINQINSIWISYTDNVNSGNWVGNCKGASSSSTVNGSSGPSTTGFVSLKFIVDATAANCTFYINGTSIGTVSSNIPTTALAGIVGVITLKSAGSNSVTTSVDYIKVRKDYTNTR